MDHPARYCWPRQQRHRRGEAGGAGWAGDYRGQGTSSRMGRRRAEPILHPKSPRADQPSSLEECSTRAGTPTAEEMRGEEVDPIPVPTLLFFRAPMIYTNICYLPTLNANFRRGTLCFAHSCTQRPRGPRTVPGKRRLSVNLCGMKEYVREAFLASLKKH